MLYKNTCALSHSPFPAARGTARPPSRGSHCATGLSLAALEREVPDGRVAELARLCLHLQAKRGNPPNEANLISTLAGSLAPSGVPEQGRGRASWGGECSG